MRLANTSAGLIAVASQGPPMYHPRPRLNDTIRQHCTGDVFTLTQLTALHQAHLHVVTQLTRGSQSSHAPSMCKQMTSSVNGRGQFTG